MSSSTIRRSIHTFEQQQQKQQRYHHHFKSTTNQTKYRVSIRFVFIVFHLYFVYSQHFTPDPKKNGKFVFLRFFFLSGCLFLFSFGLLLHSLLDSLFISHFAPAIMRSMLPSASVKCRVLFLFHFQFSFSFSYKEKNISITECYSYLLAIFMKWICVVPFLSSFYNFLSLLSHFFIPFHCCGSLCE